MSSLLVCVGCHRLPNVDTSSKRSVDITCTMTSEYTHDDDDWPVVCLTEIWAENEETAVAMWNAAMRAYAGP